MNKIYVTGFLLNVLVKALSGTAGKANCFFGRNTELLMYTKRGSDVLTVKSRSEMGPGKVFCNLPCVKVPDFESNFTISIESLRIGLDKIGNRDAYNVSGCFEFDSDGNINFFSAINNQFFNDEKIFDDVRAHSPYKINVDEYASSIEYVSGEFAVGDFKFPVYSELVAKLEQVYAIAKLVNKSSKPIILFHFSLAGLVLRLQSLAVNVSVKLLEIDFEKDELRAMSLEAFQSLKDVLAGFKAAFSYNCFVLVTESWFAIEYSRFYVQIPLICLSESYLDKSRQNFSGVEVEFCNRGLMQFIGELKISKALSDEFAKLHFKDNVLHGFSATEINSSKDFINAQNHVDVDSAPFVVRRDIFEKGLQLFGLKAILVAGLERESEVLKFSSRSANSYLIIKKIQTDEEGW